jgi:hypothetical protein
MNPAVTVTKAVSEVMAVGDPPIVKQILEIVGIKVNASDRKLKKLAAYRRRRPGAKRRSSPVSSAPILSPVFSLVDVFQRSRSTVN